MDIGQKSREISALQQEAANLHLVEAASAAAAAAIESAVDSQNRSTLVQAANDKMRAVGVKVVDCSGSGEEATSEADQPSEPASPYKTGRTREEIIGMSQRSFWRQNRLSLAGKRTVRLLAAAHFARDEPDSSKI